MVIPRASANSFRRELEPWAISSPAPHTRTKVTQGYGPDSVSEQDKVQQFGGADICCGAPLYYAGDNKGFKKVAKKLKGEIEGRGLEKSSLCVPIV